MKTKEEQIEGKEQYFVQMAKFLFLMTIFAFLYNFYLNVFAALHVFG